MGILILIQESLFRVCIGQVTPPLVTKAVEGNDTRPSTGVEQQELAKHALFQDPLRRAFFGCCTTKGAQTHQPILQTHRDQVCVLYF